MLDTPSTLKQPTVSPADISITTRVALDHVLVHCEYFSINRAWTKRPCCSRSVGSSPQMDVTATVDQEQN